MKTSLYEIHIKNNARMVEFAGWEMPVQYTGVREEHLAVRKSAGLFDVSHMGEIKISGKEALKYCQSLTTNDLTKIEDFQAQYTLLGNRKGGIIDDIIVYRFSNDFFLLCVNASNKDKVHNWIIANAGTSDIEVVDMSSQYSQLALQGPDAVLISEKLFGKDVNEIKRFRFKVFKLAGSDIIVARTGYTGENGFEMFLPWEEGPKLWEQVMEVGNSYGIKPCGLGSRDSLRIEMGYSLYGHEISEDVNPFEAGLERYVKFEENDFIGRNILERIKDEGAKRKLIAFEMEDRGIPREKFGIFKNSEKIGFVTSGTLSPCLNKSIGMGIVESSIDLDGQIEIEIRNSLRKANLVSLPFYKN